MTSAVRPSPPSLSPAAAPPVHMSSSEVSSVAMSSASDVAAAAAPYSVPRSTKVKVALVSALLVVGASFMTGGVVLAPCLAMVIFRVTFRSVFFPHRTREARVSEACVQLRREEGDVGSSPAWVLTDVPTSSLKDFVAEAGLTPFQVEFVYALAPDFKGSIRELVDLASLIN